MKKKFEKEFNVVIQKAAHIINTSETDDEAAQRFKQLSRRERRVILRAEKKKK